MTTDTYLIIKIISYNLSHGLVIWTQGRESFVDALLTWQVTSCTDHVFFH